MQQHQTGGNGHQQYRASPPSPPAHKQYPTAQSTSSAFSASANANEDWTKISDLAERRRIQNRIAQRNYRKKLKKRLEDLERRAGSSSASPEQHHEELPEHESQPPMQSTSIASSRERSTSSVSHNAHTPEILAQHYILPNDDRAMFSQQSTRQLSTSPPPFSYATVPTTEDTIYSQYSVPLSYCAMTGSGMDVPMYPQYQGLPPRYAFQDTSSTSIKQEFYGDDEINPFSMSYATINEMPPYSQMPSHTPPLSDSPEYWNPASPHEGPMTPQSLPGTPLLFSS